VRKRTVTIAVALFASSLAAFAAAEAPLVAGAAGTAAARARAGWPPTISATLAQCVTSVTQAERSATFAGEMSAVPGTAKMAMRIDVEQRLPHEPQFRAVVAPGVGAWRSSEPKVKVFKYLKQVTDLAAPARYRASIRFRWLNGHGVTIRRAVRVTRACVQPATPRLLLAPAPETASP
jgi:hypothetical protein